MAASAKLLDCASPLALFLIRHSPLSRRFEIVRDFHSVNLEPIMAFTMAVEEEPSNHHAEHHGYWFATDTNPCFTAFW
jgi:hypothetical protein